MIESNELIRIAAAAIKGEISPEDEKEAEQIIKWQQQTLAEAKANPTPLKAAVAELEHYLDTCLIEPNNATARMYASEMLTQMPEKWQVFKTVEDWIISINYIIQRAPVYTADLSKQVFFPMSKLFVFYMFTPSGSVLFRMDDFNLRITAVLNEWSEYLDSADSREVLNPNQHVPATEGWLSPASQEQFCLQQSVNYQYRDDPEKPYWNFSSFNDFFHRQLDLAKYRPVGKNEDPIGIDTAIVSANDGTVYRISRDVKYCNTFWLKGQEYSLFDMLGGAVDAQGQVTPKEIIEDFVGGDVLQSFLSGSDYHRWHAPVSGTVIESRRINGMTFSELLSEGLDLSAGTKSQGYEAMVNTRGLVIIDSPSLGKVAVIPIGITEISSVNISVKKGETVTKGEELGYFSYGGSSLALVFEPGMINKFIAEEPKDNVESCVSCKTTECCKAESGCLLVRSTVAIANVKSGQS